MLISDNSCGAAPSAAVTGSFAKRDYGTFKDSLRAPIHRWFEYPAGFSYKFIQAKLIEHDIGPDQIVLDPFAGTGTTSIACKLEGIPSVGVEAHPFVAWVAKVKLNWALDPSELAQNLSKTVELAQTKMSEARKIAKNLPELLHKCFSSENLARLVAIREAIRSSWPPSEAVGVRDFFELALTAALRRASTAKTGWPYISPNHKKASEVDGLLAFDTQAQMMIHDLSTVTSSLAFQDAQSEILEYDARVLDKYFSKQRFHIAITSPPYLNNYDYADRTRLEMYFFGQARSWKDITTTVRQRLITAATTQVTRPKSQRGELVDASVRGANADIYQKLVKAVRQLGRERLRHGGKKDYDVMAAEYFRDMVAVLSATKNVLLSGAAFVLVVGDSAPYGVHIPTERWLGELAIGLGYRRYDIEQIRTRGGKWSANPQRHSVPLRESILTICV